MSSPERDPDARPAALYLLCGLLVPLSASATYGGLALIADPSGTGLGMAPGWLARTPFPDYRVPGWLLLLALGLYPAVAAAALWLRPARPAWPALERRTGARWPWAAGLLAGVALVVWIGVQMSMTPIFFLQPVMLGLGVVIVAVSLRPSLRRYYAPSQPAATSVRRWSPRTPKREL